MADDPNRDILPVRDGSLCVDTCRSSIDPRERHLVCKLDRYELEDKYLRLLEEASNLKKLSNCQEDKIKRLATKLMRVTANPRACMVAFDIYDDKKKIIALELENTKLKDKIAVLRNQLLSHTIAGRSSSRSRNTQARPSSGRITCRSENSRTKIPSCHCVVEDGDGDNHERNNLVKIEKLEAQKKELLERISQLEKELSAYTATSQREKAAENVEYIKVWRQMKQLNDKLIAAQSTNDSLNVQINDLKRMLEETTKNNKEVSAALLAEKKRVAEVDEEMLKAKDSQLSLREKDEQINDLTNEMKILQQHNEELVALSSKYGEVELENKELKRKVTEQLHDQETLKTAFNSEQANIVSLQASNEQLLGKLQDLQSNIDSLTVQLSSFQTQTDRQEASKATQISTAQPDKKIPVASDSGEQYEDTASQVARCKKCCEAYEKILHLEETVYITRGSTKLTDKAIQTVHVATVNTKDEGTSAMTPVKEKPKDEELPVIQQNVELARTEDPLTPEKMLKLLEQAQISTPLDGARFAHKDVASNIDYNDILDLNQRHSDTETVTQASQRTPAPQSIHQQQNSDKKHSVDCPVPCEGTSLYRPKTSNDQQFAKDINNNIDVKDTRVTKKATNSTFASRPPETDGSNENNKSSRADTSVMQSGCSTRKSCSGVHNRLRQEKLKRKMLSSYKNHNHVARLAETEDCTCDDSLSCRFNSGCNGRCCNSSPAKSLAVCTSNNGNMQFGMRPTMTKNTGNDWFDSSVQNYAQNLGTMYMTRKVLDEASTSPYRPLEKNTSSENRNDVADDNKTLHEYVKQLDACRKLLGSNCSINNVTGMTVKDVIDHAKITDPIRCRINEEPIPETRKVESFCSLNCPNECIDTSSSVSDSFPLMIADGQGLMELHILSLQLSTSAKQILFQEKDIRNVSLFISWNIWNQETAYTPTLKCPKLNFNSSFVYRITNLSSFFNYVLLEYIIFQVNVYHEDNSYTVSTGKLCIKDILDYPQNKLHYIAPVNSVLPCSLGDNFGQLSLWVRLSCDIDKVEAYKKKRGLHFQIESPMESLMASSAEVPLEPSRESPLETVIQEEVPEKVTPVPSNDLLVLKEGGSKDHLAYEKSKDQLSLYEPSTLLPKSSESSEETPDNNLPTPDASTLTVMKESEKEIPYSQKSVNILNLPESPPPVETVKEDETPQEVETDPPDSNLKSEATAESEKKETHEAQSERSSIVEFKAMITNDEPDVADQQDSGDSIHEVTDVFSQKNWEEYRRRSIIAFSNIQRQNGDETELNDEDDSASDETLEENTIIIEIVNMVLFPKSSVMKNDEIQLLYIEYSFLGHCGADMETVSMKKPKPPNQKLTYNFRRKFQVDAERHSVQESILRSMLHDSMDPNIKFIIVSEPIPEETDTKECVEIGYAYFNIREYALGDTENIVSLPIYNPDDSENIGLLKINVLGLDTIRQRLARRDSSF